MTIRELYLNLHTKSDYSREFAAAIVDEHREELILVISDFLYSKISYEEFGNEIEDMAYKECEKRVK
jgi:aspartate/methionine/tyrosine aminotransferase